MLFLDLRFLFGGKRGAESEFKIVGDELLVGEEKRTDGPSEGVAEVCDEICREKGEEPNGDSVEVVCKALHHRLFQWMKRRGCSSSRLGVMPASLLAS